MSIFPGSRQAPASWRPGHRCVEYAPCRRHPVVPVRPANGAMPGQSVGRAASRPVASRADSVAVGHPLAAGRDRHHATAPRSLHLAPAPATAGCPVRHRRCVCVWLHAAIAHGRATAAANLLAATHHRRSAAARRAAGPTAALPVEANRPARRACSPHAMQPGFRAAVASNRKNRVAVHGNPLAVALARSARGATTAIAVDPAHVHRWPPPALPVHPTTSPAPVAGAARAAAARPTSTPSAPAKTTPATLQPTPVRPGQSGISTGTSTVDSRAVRGWTRTSILHDWT